jgi:NADPH-dependent ferric siderophore reductase
MKTSTAPASRVQRVRHEIRRRDVEVVRVVELSPHFRSVTFGGDALEGFLSASFDDHVKFVLPGAGGNPVMRDYTPRRFDAGKRELTIEFALHGDGPAANWAAQAVPGQHATIAGPRGSLIIPLDYEWHLFIGDETALPAIARRLEELPAGARAIVLAQVDEPDRRVFATAANLSVQWMAQPSQLIEAARSVELPAGEGYAWCAGEAKAMAAVRRILVEDKGHDRQAIRAAAYWKQGVTAHHENLESD